MVYKHIYSVGLNNINANYQVTNKAILEYLENCAAIDAIKAKAGIEDANKKNQTFLISEWDLKVLTRPKFMDKVEINSWLYNKTGKCAYCNFEGFVNNQKVFIAACKLVLFDLNTHTVIHVDENYLANFKPENNFVINLENLDKIDIPKNYVNEKNIFVRKSDLDMNNHVHNLIYLDYLKEINDQDNDNLRIIYLNEVKYDDNVTINHKNNIYIIKSNDIINTIIISK